MTPALRTLLLTLLLSLPLAAQERSPMQVRAKVNGVSAVLVLDTGAAGVVLFRSSATRLKLDLAADPDATATATTGTVSTLVTQPTIDVQGQAVTSRVEVLTVPPSLRVGVDGLIGWDVLRDRVFYLKRGAGLLVILPQAPADLDGFGSWPIDPASHPLAITATDGDTPLTIILDSGKTHGVALSPARWQAWIAATPDRPYTLNAAFRTGIGLQITREYFADRLALGDLVIDYQPVIQSPAAKDPAAQPAAILGLRTLDRLEIIIDGPAQRLYARPVSDLRSRYDYNRLGAVFAPADLDQLDLLATVAPGSPAAAAGIQDGDRLLAVSDLDCTAWRTDPRVMPISRFFDLPAGTKIPLTLGRGTTTYTVEVTLAEIFPAATPPAPAD